MEDLVQLVQQEDPDPQDQGVRLVQLAQQVRRDHQENLYVVRQERLAPKDLKVHKVHKDLLDQEVNLESQVDLDHWESLADQVLLDHQDQEVLQEQLDHLVH